MCKLTLFAWGLCAIGLAGCQWAITPQRDLDPAGGQAAVISDAPGDPGLSHQPANRQALVEMGPAGPACTVDQGDDRPMVEGRCYVIVYAYREERMRAYGLKQMLVERGHDVVVGHHPGHHMYFVRSRKGYDGDDQADRQEMVRLVRALTAALGDVARENPSLLVTTIRDMAPEVFYARRP